MAELGMSTRERLARAVARQIGVKVCSKCHIGIISRDGGGCCDYCKDYPPVHINKPNYARP